MNLYNKLKDKGIKHTIVSDTDITVEDIQKWKEEMDAKNPPKRQYKLYWWGTEKGFNKMWNKALLDASRKYH